MASGRMASCSLLPAAARFARVSGCSLSRTCCGLSTRASRKFMLPTKLATKRLTGWW
ncbi:hypothetical protein D3C76_1559830 [compost metagenome]